MVSFTLKKEIKIGSPVEKVFDFLVSPKKIPLVMPGLIENSNVPKLPLKKGSTFKYKYQMHGVILKGVWTVKEVAKNKKYSAKTSGEIISDWDYKFSKSGNGTNLKLNIKYTMPNSVLSGIQSSVMKKLNDKEFDHFIYNLKEVCELNP